MASGTVLLACLAALLASHHPAWAQEAKPASQPEGEKRAGERVLRFPADRSVGTVDVRPRRAGTYKHTAYVDFRSAGEARAEVRVPADADVQLNVGKGPSKDLSFLDSLGPDDVQILILENTDATDEGLKHVGRLTGLRILGLNHVRISDAGIRHLTGLKQLEQLDLDAFGINEEGFGIGDEALRTLALAKLPELKAIGLRLTKVTDEGMAALALIKSLESIEIPGTKITDAGVAHLKGLPRLDSLGLGVYNEGAAITDAALTHLGEMKQLRRLDLSGTAVTDAGLAFLSGLTQLEHLSLDNTKITNAGLARLEPLVSLRSLRCYIDITNLGARNLSKVRSLRRIECNLRITDEGVEALAELPELESLNLYGDGITDASANHIARMKSIASVHFQNCPITDAALERLSGVPTLTAIHLSRTRVTGEGLKVLTNLPRLELLGIDFGMRRKGFFGENPSLRHVGSLSGLRYLDIFSGSGELAGSELEHLQGLTELHRLSLSGVQVDDHGAFQLGGLVSLKSLSLGDTIITDVGLEHLSNLRRLEYLSLTGHFAPRGLEKLKRLKSLARLSLSSPNLTQADVDAFVVSTPSIGSVWFSPDERLRDVSVSDRDDYRRDGEKEVRAKLDELEGRPPPALQVASWVNEPEEGFSFEKLRGKVVLVDFLDTQPRAWVTDALRLKRAYDKHHEQGLEIVGVHTTAGTKTMKASLDAQKIPWPVAADVNDETRAAYFAESQPGWFLIDRSGKLRVARIYRGDLERAIKELLAEQ